MPNIETGILVVGHPHPGNLDLGGRFINRITETPKGRFSVIAVELSGLLQDDPQLKRLTELNDPHSQIVVVSTHRNIEFLKVLVNKFPVFKVLSDFSEPSFSLTIREAQSQRDLLLQSHELAKIQESLRTKLFNAHLDLEQKLSERRHQKFEFESRRKEIQGTLQVLHETLLLVFESQTVPEIESHLARTLSQNPKLSSIRISYSRRGIDKTTPKFPIRLGGRTIASLEVVATESLTVREENLLERIAEAVGLAIEKLAKLEQAESLKREWELTFDSVSDPFCIIDDQYNLVRFNHSFARRAGRQTGDVAGSKCYKTLFKRDQPCESCTLGKNFRLSLVQTADGHWRLFEVTSQKLRNSHFIMHYGDQTNRQRILKRISESAKLAELGTIGGSIAHELNNPIAGMLTFTQLMKMDLKGDETYYQDILDLEAGILRCKEIVQNLLSFTRKPDLQNLTEFDLASALNQAIQIVSVRSRSLGVVPVLKTPNRPIHLKGQVSLIIQAFVNLFQDSIDALERRKQLEPSFVPRMEILLRDDTNPTLEILDNGLPHSLEDSSQLKLPVTSIDNERLTPGLGLTLAYQILEQHGGSLEFLEAASPKESSTMRTQAKISFARPVF